MPSKTPQQQRLMAAAANSPAVAKRTGVPQPVAQEFMAADAGQPAPRPMAKAGPADVARQQALAAALRRRKPGGGF
jgi:hypothetical protein